MIMVSLHACMYVVFTYTVFDPYVCFKVSEFRLLSMNFDGPFMVLVPLTMCMCILRHVLLVFTLMSCLLYMCVCVALITATVSQG